MLFKKDELKKGDMFTSSVPSIIKLSHAQFPKCDVNKRGFVNVILQHKLETEWVIYRQEKEAHIYIK